LTTPNELRLGLIVLAISTLFLGVAAVSSSVRRLDAARTLAVAAAPQLNDAQDVYVHLADADAAASNAFLRCSAGVCSHRYENDAALQSRYDADISAATSALPALARRADTTDAKVAVATITKKLPVYTGYIEAARANNRQGFPVGPAYLHEASSLMRSDVLPAATTIYEDAQVQLDSSDNAGGSSSETSLVITLGIIVGLLAIAMLGLLAIRTRRIVNVGLALAILFVVAIVVVSTVAFASERSALRRSRTTGADQLQVLSAARILTLRSFSDENLDLIERGAAPEFVPDFARVNTALSGSSPASGLLQTPYVASPIPADYAAYLALHQQLTHDNDNGDYRDAVQIATTTEPEAVQRLDAAFTKQINTAQARLETNARDARNALAAVALTCIVLTALAIVAIVLGLRPRIQEYQ
jgi:hypothetical protein